jgi:hypothetical protein
MLQKNHNDLTILVYDNPKPPKCLKLNKKVLRFFLFFLPLILTLSILITTYILANLKKIRLENELKQPQIITELKNEIKSHKATIVNNKVENKSLIDKIAKGATSSNEDNISLLNLPLGYNNFINKAQATIEEVTHKVLPSGSQLSFKVANKLINQRFSGYLYVIRISNNNFEVYPNIDLGVDDFLLNYNRGESITALRFKAITAKFRPVKADIYTYKVIIFSRLGDLVFKKNFGPYKNEQ